MSQDMYKTLTGWQVLKEDDVKHEATHKLLENAEYEGLRIKLQSLQAEIERLKNVHAEEINSMRRQCDNDRQTIREQANSRIDSIRQQAQTEIKEAKEETEKAKKEAETERNRNKNLIKVAKERANKARKMPKKGQSYIIQEKYKKDLKFIEKEQKETKEYHIQPYYLQILTPWDCSMDEATVDNLVMQDLKQKDLNIGNGFVWYKKNPTKLSKDDFYDTDKLIMQRNYRCNVKTGFWEVTMITNQEPEIDPKHRPSKYA